MRLIHKPIDPDESHFYMPHHGIDIDKFRVVFNGSSPTSSGQSCNDVQMLGERLQDDLPDILMRFRLHEVAVVADIRQMYRQMLVPENQQKYQLIVWREKPTDKLQTYALTTVTYGMKHAPHTAVRTLLQIARDHETTHPVASEVTKRDFYMDDLITGTRTTDQAIELYEQAKDMMNNAGMELRKWASNKWEVVEAFDEADSRNSSPVELDPNNVLTVLGAYWNPQRDSMQFQFRKDRSVKATTKRTVAGEIAKIFDPTGLVAPIITRGKQIVREIWQRNLGWDDELPADIQTGWDAFYATMGGLDQARVPRWLGTNDVDQIRLHGFAGASSTAYAAVVYSIVTEATSHNTCRLFTAKTKIAPMKPVSTARLELCAMRLLAQLMERVQTTTGIKAGTIWTSSPVALAWITEEPDALKPYVANRVSEIRSLTHDQQWKHTTAEQNPAQVAAVGTDVNGLLACKLWWEGPQWLSENTEVSPEAAPELTDQERQEISLEKKPVLVGTVQEADMWIATRYHSITQLATTTAIVQKCIKRWRQCVASKRDGTYQGQPDESGVNIAMAEARAKLPPGTTEIEVQALHRKLRRQSLLRKRITGLTRDEMSDGENFWVRWAQSQAYGAEIATLKAGGRQLPKSSRLARLAPFIGLDGLLRVGGRLQHSYLTPGEKFPVILPAEHFVTKWMIQRAHLALLHGGPQVTGQEMRKQYWLVGGRSPIRQVIHQCQVCKRFRGIAADQQMAALVPARVRPSRPFNTASVDYCGPFEVKRYSGRCNTKIKCYVAVFICMWSRAIHLEVVNDLSTDGFLDAYHRFAARRGHCSKIISDNATNFIGAKKRIDTIRKHIEESADRNYFRNLGIEWQFIAPRAPWQGGSHEAAVKLMKHHLRRAMVARSLSITEFSSLITRIEGCVNSRPLTKLPEDGMSETALTPMHFLVASSPRQAATEKDVTDRKTLASRWQAIQQTQQVFWRKWQTSYLNHLQMRNKRMFPQPNIQVGDIVIVKDELTPPQHWPLGRITETYPGLDGLVRNVTVRMNGKEYIRAVQKLIPLQPAEDTPGGTGEAELQAADDRAITSHDTVNEPPLHR